MLLKGKMPLTPRMRARAALLTVSLAPCSGSRASKWTAGGHAHRPHILPTQGGPVITRLREDRAGAPGGQASRGSSLPVAASVETRPRRRHAGRFLQSQPLTRMNPLQSRSAGRGEGEKGDEVA